jgi:glycosyltransferase involved in cell wall biosynthesis
MFSTYNEMDFGRPGIQYILDPLFTRSLLLLLNPRPSPLRRIFYRNAALRRSYLGLARRLSRTDPAGIRRNLTLVDSDWTGGWTRTHLGVEPVTLYPPVPDPGPGRPWDQREEGFVCLGRIIPEKQADKVLTIVEGLRARGIEAHLHIIGSIGDRAFGRRLKAAAADRPWVRIEERVSAEQKRVILASHRYGLHGKENEPFGIAVAEMAAAGCLVWVPAGGGQTEIVGHPDLIYESVPEAVSKIQAILGSPERRDALRDALRGRMARFSTERFAKEVGAVVRRFLEGGSAGGEGGR